MARKAQPKQETAKVDETTQDVVEEHDEQQDGTEDTEATEKAPEDTEATEKAPEGNGDDGKPPEDTETDEEADPAAEWIEIATQVANDPESGARNGTLTDAAQERITKATRKLKGGQRTHVPAKWQQDMIARAQAQDDMEGIVAASTVWSAAASTGKAPATPKVDHGERIAEMATAMAVLAREVEAEARRHEVPVAVEVAALADRARATGNETLPLEEAWPGAFGGGKTAVPNITARTRGGGGGRSAGRSLSNLPSGTEVEWRRRDGTHRATIQGGSIVLSDGRTFDSPSGAARAIAQSEVNGWQDAWKLQDGRTLAEAHDEAMS